MVELMHVLLPVWKKELIFRGIKGMAPRVAQLKAELRYDFRCATP